MIHLLLSFLAGALFNWYRGGPLHNRDEVVSRIKPEWLRRIVYFLVQGDTVNAIAFGLFCVIAHRSQYQGIVDGMPVYVFLAGAFALFCVQVVMMFRGATPGWGEYIGAAGGWRPTAADPIRGEVPYIDKIIDEVFPGLKISNPRLWGVLGLSLRCGEWGLFIGVPLVAFIGFQVFLVVLAGLMAGPVVFILSKILPQRFVWPVFEAVLGGLLWISCA